MEESKSANLTLEEKHHLLCVHCFVHASMKKGGVLAVGPPKSGKTTFSKHFAVEAAKIQRLVFYVTIDEPPEDVKQSFDEILPDPRLESMIHEAYPRA